MTISIRHWSFALLVAVLVHGMLLSQMLQRSTPIVSTASPGMTISFVVATPDPPSEASPSVDPQPLPPPIETEPPPVEPEVAPEPEPIPEPEPEPIPPPEPKPEPVIPKADLEPVTKPPVKQRPKDQPRPRPKPRPAVTEQTKPVSPSPTPRRLERTVGATSPAPTPSVPAQPSRSAMADYYQLLGQRLASAKRYPSVAMRRRQQGVVKLRLSIAADGTLLSATVAESSNHRSLDQAALKLARDSSPLPPPQAGAVTPVEVLVPVRYRLR